MPARLGHRPAIPVPRATRSGAPPCRAGGRGARLERAVVSDQEDGGRIRGEHFAEPRDQRGEHLSSRRGTAPHPGAPAIRGRSPPSARPPHALPAPCRGRRARRSCSSPRTDVAHEEHQEGPALDPDPLHRDLGREPLSPAAGHLHLVPTGGRRGGRRGQVAARRSMWAARSSGANIRSATSRPRASPDVIPKGAPPDGSTRPPRPSGRRDERVGRAFHDCPDARLALGEHTRGSAGRRGRAAGDQHAGHEGSPVA